MDLVGHSVIDSALIHRGLFSCTRRCLLDPSRLSVGDNVAIKSDRSVDGLLRTWPSSAGVCYGRRAANANSRLLNINRCRKLYRCQQLNQDISELFSLADQSLFSSLQKNSHDVLQRLLLAKSTQPYNLRPRRHSFSLTQKQSSYDDCNFTISTDWSIS